MNINVFTTKAGLFQCFAIAATIVAGGAAGAHAASQHEPGSALIFPWFESGPGMDTILTVTNTNLDKARCPGSEYRAGDVLVRYLYFDGDQSQIPEFSRFELLTPGDTLSVLTSRHNLNHERGFVFVIAIDPNDWFNPIDYNYLVGSARVVDRVRDGMWEYTPCAFQAVAESADACAPASTDADGDGAADFDGIEYEKFPSRLILDSFFEETGRATNQIVFMTTAGIDLSAELNLWFWNNQGQKFTRSFRFQRSWSGTLSQISTIATNLGGDAEEFFGKQIGWVEIQPGRIVDGAGNPVPDLQGGVAKPPVLAVFAQFVNGLPISGGTSLHMDGELDGLELPRGDEDPQDNS